MKPPHELDERVRDIIRNVLVGFLLGRLGKTILGRVGSSVPLDHPHAKHARDALWIHLANEGEGLFLGCGAEKPEVSSQPSNIGANGDGPLPMPLRLVLNREGDEIGKVDDVPEAALGAKVCQHFKEEKRMWRVRACSSFTSLNSSVYKPSAIENSRTPSRYNGPQLKVELKVFGKAFIGCHRGTAGEGDEFPWLDPRKMTLPSSSSKQVQRFSFLVKTTWYV
ncbi:hypothetical protein GOBAR_AA29129 [Gossypium barbadense]|uniref:Uncharacterized protein n=1 Tax=Gossypium barbadense TaxID=3634 RepID=A0A2P5WKH8_GOSBA|nr:hypothetical protein GOBAR_AA29129 [Gossypium barbadense]